ncbi:ATP-binding protein [Thiorhodococcus mannitoliphagus]|uniref:ATP-binding protein n=2 Tax=Thiorhodococcus mannitoliphagus TaxID=329406 RepID=A0A6P1DWL7_9GAMM|nr:ATP-binding protein [Thiorhodococcus mannitoliphagus]
MLTTVSLTIKFNETVDEGRRMKSSTGRWVTGTNFFDRHTELKLLQQRIEEGNHVSLTGQRRMGKTSVARELGRRLEAKGWVFLFADIEGAAGPEDVIAELAKAVQRVQPLAMRFAAGLGRWLGDRIEELSALDFKVKVRAALDAATWRRHGEKLLADCAHYEKPVLLVVDELPIFLKRIQNGDDGPRRVDEFLSWFRQVLQDHANESLVVMVSGSIGLRPLVERLGIPDRINHLDPFRLGPWGKEDSEACLRLLAESYDIQMEDAVPGAVYEKLGIGIPHHVQSFFARLRDHSIKTDGTCLTVEDVDYVYRNELLGPSGQNDLVHYETRLKDGLDEANYPLAMEILAEAAVVGVFSVTAQHCLASDYAEIVDDVRARIVNTLDVLVHDGYLEESGGDYRFPSLLLRDWWSARFRGHHVPLGDRQRASR